MLLLKIDKNLDKQQYDNEQDEHKDGDESNQHALLSDKGMVDNSQLNLFNKLLPPNWFTKAKIVVSHDYHFIVIALIDFGTDMNCIQKGLIPSKYFEKSIERLVSANGSQMKIKYELNNAHVCHDNVCFKIFYVLVKNMTDKTILGLLFVNALYPFLVEHDGITTNPFGQKVKFKFASKCEIDTDYASNLIHAKVEHLNFLKQEVRHKKIFEQLSGKILQQKIVDKTCSDVSNAFWHKKRSLSYVKDIPVKVFIQEPRMGSCQYFTDTFEGNTHRAKLLTIINDPNILNISLQELDNATWINTTNKWNNNNTSIYTTGKWIIMASSADWRDKGKALAQGCSQDIRLPAGRSFVMQEGTSLGVKPNRSTSLLEFVPEEVTYSSGDMVIALQEVLSRKLQFHNGTYSELPDSIKFILDNLQAAFTRDHRKLFQKTLRALEIHLVNLTAQNEAYTSHYANLALEYANLE